jgi:CAAX prenyl protease-like protein
MSFPLGRSALVRIAPFALFVLLLWVRGAMRESAAFDARWVYGIGVLLCAAALLAFWREYGEFARQNLPTPGEAALAAVVGGVVFVLWITLDAPWMQLGDATAPFTPLDANGQPMWPLIAVRWIGAALLVPLVEELFWRSFLMRWIDSPVFEAVDPRRVSLKAIMLSTFVFMLMHTLWLAAIIAGLAYAWLYRRTGKLWVAVIAHAVTNGALGVWVVATGSWAFW